jgi:type III pantothenate kinase
MLLLAIDAGNTFVKWAYHDGQSWRHPQRVLLADFYRNPKQYLQHRAQRMLVANVAGSAVQAAIETIFPGQVVQWVKASSHACGVSNQYAAPEQLGADRWAMLIAARAMTQADCIVVSLGTALTVDMLAHDGRFLGGVIAPGMRLMRTALAQGTAAVAPPPGQVTRFPGNTADAVQTGLVYATLGVIEKTLAEFEAQCQQPVSCILTGGGADRIAPYLNRPFQVVDNLVLEGLRLLAQQEKAQ